MTRKKLDIPTWDIVGRPQETHHARTGIVLGVVTVSALAYAGHAQRYESDEPQPPSHQTTAQQRQHLEASAELVATKYDSCAITTLHDLHRQPPISEMADEGEDRIRTTLDMTVKVDRNEKAAVALEEFDTRDGVQWDAPILQAQYYARPSAQPLPVTGPGIEGEYRLPDSNIARDKIDVREATSSFDIQLYPIVNHQIDNAEIRFNVVTSANVGGDESTSRKKTRTCTGKAMYDLASRSWSLS